MCYFKNGSQWDYNVNHMHLRGWQFIGFIHPIMFNNKRSQNDTKWEDWYSFINSSILPFFLVPTQDMKVVVLCYCWMNYLPLLFGLVPFNSQTYLGIPVLSCGMLDKLTLSGFLNNVTLNFALRSGSSKQGKARLASVGSNWVVAK
jgi:hypothetical protein